MIVNLEVASIPHMKSALNMKGSVVKESLPETPAASWLHSEHSCRIHLAEIQLRFMDVSRHEHYEC
jgi:hypothetical protein